MASILCKKLRRSAFDVMMKKKHAAKTKTLICTCSLCQPGSTLSSPIHSSSSLSPPFSPRWPWLCSSVLLHHWRSLVLSVYRRRGEGAGKRDSAPLTLPHSVYAPTDTQTLSTVRSSSLQQPKKGTRAHRARRQTIETIKKPSQAVSTEEAWNCTTGSVDFFFSSFQSTVCVRACACVFCLAGFFSLYKCIAESPFCTGFRDSL